MTLRAELVENWRANPWLRRQSAFLLAMAAWMFLVFWLSLGFPGFVASLLLDGVFVACGVKTGKAAGALKSARLAEATRLAKESAELRTPRAPDAGPDQCPVCGGYGLAELAADDAFMEREPERAKVVAWGRKRAHSECAEFVPYVPTEYERKAEIHKREHNSTTYVEQRCILCLTEDDRRRHEKPRRPTVREFEAELAAIKTELRRYRQGGRR